MDNFEKAKEVLGSNTGKVEQFLTENKDWIIENFAMSFVPFLMLVFARRGNKAYVKFEIFATIMHGMVLLFCPKTIFKHLVKVELDSYHYFLFTLSATISISSMLYPLFFLNSKDENILTGHHHSRMIFHVCAFMVSVYQYKFDREWTYRIVCTYGGVNLVGFFVNCYFYVTTSKARTHSTFNDTINFFAKLESLKGFVYGLMFFGFPKMVLLSNSGNSHMVFARIIGLFMLSMGLQAQGVSDFMYLADKKTFILTRLIGGFFTLQALLVGFYFYNEVSFERIAMVVGGFVVYSGVLAYGYNSAKIKKD